MFLFVPTVFVYVLLFFLFYIEGIVVEEGNHGGQRNKEEVEGYLHYVDPIIFTHNYQTFPNFTKVIVPSVYMEYKKFGLPIWITNKTIQEKLAYSVFLYQKLDSTQPNFIRNRGTEGAVYLRYIVDHYDNFPDVAIFTHAVPNDHATHWLEQVGCINPNASYININFRNLYRTTNQWAGKGELWVEQCWRDVLRITWDLENNPTEFHRLAPPKKPLIVSFSCCQQFIMSRAMVQKRPKRIWQQLLKIVNEQDVCHIGEPDYEDLYTYKKNRKKVGPEPSSIVEAGDLPNRGYGAHTQGGAMEHLAHVIFGGSGLDMEFPDMNEICKHYVPNCPFSPCTLQQGNNKDQKQKVEEAGSKPKPALVDTTTNI